MKNIKKLNNFLNLRIWMEEGKLVFDIYRKQTNTNTFTLISVTFQYKISNIAFYV